MTGIVRVRERLPERAIAKITTGLAPRGATRGPIIDKALVSADEWEIPLRIVIDDAFDVLIARVVQPCPLHEDEVFQVT